MTIELLLERQLNYILDDKVRKNLIDFINKISKINKNIYFESKENDCDFCLYKNYTRIMKFICRRSFYKLVIKKDTKFIPDSPKHILKEKNYFLYDRIYKLSNEEMEKFINFIKINYL